MTFGVLAYRDEESNEISWYAYVPANGETPHIPLRSKSGTWQTVQSTNKTAPPNIDRAMMDLRNQGYHLVKYYQKQVMADNRHSGATQTNYAL
jgi:translation initiation factor 2 beta subunit (eIF-2beta)/eIF-5